MKCAHYVYEVLEQGISLVMNKSLDSRKSLRVFIQDNMESLIEENYSKLKECIKESVESEQCYINYDD
jgi:hypothetical protein